MKIKYIIIILATAFTSAAQGMNTVEFLEEKFGLISVTSTNLGIKFKSSRFIIVLDKKWIVTYRSSEYMDEPFILSPDREQLSITDNEGMAVDFTAVYFKNQFKGFRVAHRIHGFGRIVKTNVMYLALSDTPLDVGEEDYLEDIPVKEKTSAELDVIMREAYKARSAARRLKLAREQARASNEIASASSPALPITPVFAETNLPVVKTLACEPPGQIEQRKPAQDAAAQNESDATAARHWLWLFVAPVAGCFFLFIRRRA